MESKSLALKFPRSISILSTTIFLPLKFEKTFSITSSKFFFANLNRSLLKGSKALSSESDKSNLNFLMFPDTGIYYGL